MDPELRLLDDHSILSEGVVTATVSRCSGTIPSVTSRDTTGDESHTVRAILVNSTLLVEAKLSEQSKNQTVLCRVVIFVVIALALIAATTMTFVMTMKETRPKIIPLLPTNAPSYTQFEHVAITRSLNQTIGQGYLEYQHLNSSSVPLGMLAGGQEFLDLINRTSVNMTVFGQTVNAFAEFMHSPQFLIKIINNIWYAHSVSKNCPPYITMTL
jgi:hypothetical protein